MNAQNWTDFLEKMFSLSLGAIGTWLALKTFYERRHKETLERFAEGRQKEYAAERDFEHLRRNQEQLKVNLSALDDELQDAKADVKEIKGMISVFLARFNDSSSNIWGKRE